MTDTARKAARRVKSRALPEPARDDASASTLLLQQLHQVQEELEQHFLRCMDLDADLQLAHVERDEAMREVEALRLQLAHMQRELAALARTPAASGSLRSRLAALVPGRFSRARARNAARPEIESIRGCEWFDAAWYLSTYRDVREADMDPAEHYYEFGWKEGRDPGPAFDTGAYLRANQDVAAAGLNPLWHFIEYGRKEGRQPVDG